MKDRFFSVELARINYQYCGEMVYKLKMTVLQQFYLLFKMLKVPLDFNNHRDNSVSSCGDQSFDPRKLSAQVDQQKRVIRRLTLKVSKLEEALKKQRRQTRNPKMSSMSSIPSNPQFSVLRDQIERANLLEDAVNQLYSKSITLLRLIPDSTSSSPKKSLETVPSYKSLTSIDMSNRQESTDDNQIFKRAKRALNNLENISKKIENQKDNHQRQEQQNKSLKIEIKKIKSYHHNVGFQMDELKQFKNQYENQRKNCVRLKTLLEKSQYERNNILTKIHRMPAKHHETINNHEDLVVLSKSLTCRINHLEKQKKEIIDSNMKEKERWQKKYRQFLRKVKYQKQKVQELQKAK